MVEGGEDGSVPVRRSPSSSGPSSPVGALRSPPPVVQPKAGYIAAAAASQIITDNCVETGNTALVSQSSLDLVNAFLDQLLYNFLVISRSTSLASLKPAITDVLKPRLAREAIAGADQELSEYLGGSIDDEEPLFRSRYGGSGSWDAELVWKRTRLRCMVYSSLGDMEEQDEDAYTEEQQLDPALGSQSPGAHDITVVSPAVAIFLTSILEFIGEQTLMIAGQAAYERFRGQRSGSRSGESGESPHSPADRVVVEDLDTEKVALNAVLGRLWRTWRRRLRTPTASLSRLLPDGSPAGKHRSPRVSPRGSVGSLESPTTSMGSGYNDGNDALRRPSIAEVVNQEELAANIPLPTSTNDVAEIEVPGYGSADDVHQSNREAASRRRRSLVDVDTSPLDTTGRLPFRELGVDDERSRLSRPTPSRARSRSLPSLSRTPYQPQAEGDQSPSGMRSDHDHPDDVVSAEDGGCDTDTEGHPKASKEPVGHRAETIEPSTREKTCSSSVAHEARSVPAIDYPEDTDSFSLDIEGKRGKGFRETAEPSPMATPERRIRATNEDEDVPVGDLPWSRTGNVTSSASPNGLGIVEEELEGEGEDEKHVHDSKAIGVARTSDIPMSSSPGPASRQNITHGTKAVNGTSVEVDSTRRYGYQSPINTLATSLPEKERGNVDSRAVANPPSTSRPMSRATHGAPSLTPLREMMESAGDTSDDASVKAVPVAQSSSNKVYPPSNHAFHGSKSTDGVQQPLPMSTSTPRAAVQRVYTPPELGYDADSGRSRRSTSVGKEQRGLHPSGSNSSQLSHRAKKAITSNQNDSIDKKGRVSQQSDRVSLNSDGPSLTMPNDKERSFEQLMQSDETIQYTLTPRHVRDMEWPEAPKHARTETADLADFLKNTGPPGPSVTRANGQYGTASSNRNAASYNPRLNSSGTPSPQMPQAKYVPITPTNSTISKARASTHEPRDARVGKENTREIAEFLRSTEPNPDQMASPVIASMKSPKGTPRSPSSPMGPGNDPTQSRSPTSSRSGPRLQAREAKAHDNMDLDFIDFIRQGPGDDRVDRRSPGKTALPVKSAPDSDDMPGANDRSDRIISSVSMASTQDSYGYPKSLQSSLNSRTALLGQQNNGSTLQSSYAESAQPMRKQSRVKDPYAIDYDDDYFDEEDEDPIPVRKPQRQEESLIDFLRNVPPPSEVQALPVVGVSAANDPPKLLQKKNSSPTLRSRLMPSNNSLRTSGRKSSLPKGNGILEDEVTEAPRVPLNPDIYNGGTIVSGGKRARSAGGAGSGQHLPEAREPYVSAATRELADFLRNSGPPPSAQATQTARSIKEERTLARMIRKVRAGARVI